MLGSIEERLTKALKTYIKMELYADPSVFNALGKVAEVLLELREIMLIDNPFDTLTEEAIIEIKRWIRNTKKGKSYNLAEVLRKIREG
jgi:energy-converting hydrogenase Eha subunit B